MRVYSYGAGGGGSGGSVLMEACNVTGSGTVSAKGGPSLVGSGAGGGGRVSIRAAHVSSELVFVLPYSLYEHFYFLMCFFTGFCFF